MQRLIIRALLPIALTLTLAACGDDPETSTEDAPKAAAADAPDAAPRTAAKQPDAQSTFERAMRALTSGTSLRFESEVVLSDGSSQYATGVSEEHKYAFNVRTLPKANAEFDGNWFFSGGRYQRESTAGYDSSLLTPSAMSIMTEALDAIPKTEASLLADPPIVETAGGVSCQSRKVNLGQFPRLLTQYKTISVCIDETNVRLVKLQAELQTGERLIASYSDYGLPVQMPSVKAFDWSQEFPRR